MAEIPDWMTAELREAFDNVRRAPVVDLKNAAHRQLLFVMNTVEAGESIPPHHEIAEALDCAVRTVERNFRIFRDKGLIWATPNGAGGSDYVFGAAAMNAIAGRENTRQDDQTPLAEPRQIASKPPLVSGFSRAGEHEDYYTPNGLSHAEIDSRVTTLKRFLKDAGVVHGNAIVNRTIEAYAANPDTDFEAWARAAEAAAGAGQNGKRFDYFEGAYEGIVATDTDAEAEGSGLDDIDPAPSAGIRSIESHGGSHE